MEVRRLVDTAYQSAKGILSVNREVLTKIAMALLDREVLDANEIRLLIDGKELPRSSCCQSRTTTVASSRC